MRLGTESGLRLRLPKLFGFWPEAYHDGLVVRVPEEDVVLYLEYEDPEPDQLETMSVQQIAVDHRATDDGILSL